MTAAASFLLGCKAVRFGKKRSLPTWQGIALGRREVWLGSRGVLVSQKEVWPSHISWLPSRTLSLLNPSCDLQQLGLSLLLEDFSVLRSCRNCSQAEGCVMRCGTALLRLNARSGSQKRVCIGLIPIGTGAKSIGIALIPIGIDTIPAGINLIPIGIGPVPIDFALIPIGIAPVPIGNAPIPIDFALIPIDIDTIPIGIRAKQA